MNLLEQYIEEIYSVEDAENKDWMDEPYVKVDMSTDCYGRIERGTHYFSLSEWEHIKEKGYYMG